MNTGSSFFNLQKIKQATVILRHSVAAEKHHYWTRCVNSQLTICSAIYLWTA